MTRKMLYVVTPVIIFFAPQLHAQFYKSVNVETNDVVTGVIAMNNGFVYGFTEFSSVPHNHNHILLIKTNATGIVAWSKAYDVGPDTSLTLVQMIHTFDDGILLSGEVSTDNRIGAKRCVIKLRANGSLSWAKQFGNGDAYSFKGLLQLQDSSFVFSAPPTQQSAAIVQVNNSGNLIVAAKILNNNFAAIQHMTAFGNSVDVVTGSHNGTQDKNVANIDFKKRKIQWQRQYKTSNQFTSLISTRCRNGDIVYLAGRTSGGLLNGTSRIFRTNASGNLKWAKNISATFDGSGSLFSVFDIVQQVYVHEDADGNIIAVVEEESTATLLVAFDANGKYLYNRFLDAGEMAFYETANKNYLTASYFGFPPHNALVAYRDFAANTVCDSSLIVKITNGTDSAAVVNSLSFAPISVATIDLNVAATNKTIVSSVYCNLINKQNIIPTAISVKLFPNPAVDQVKVETKEQLPFTITSLSGETLIMSYTNRLTDISRLRPGLYFIIIKAKQGFLKKVLIKQ